MFVKKVPLKAVQENYRYYAPTYEVRWEHFLSPTRDWVLEHFPTPATGHLLSLGCGTGRFLSEIKQRHPALTITGIDGSEDMLAIARQTMPNASFRQADLADIELPENQYDVVLCLNVLHFLNDPPALLNKIKKTVKPGGVAFIGDYAIETPILAMAELYWHLFDVSHHQALSIREFKTLLRGFSIEESAFLKPDWFWRLQVYKLTVAS